MTTTLTNQPIDRKALERVLDAPAEVARPTVSDEVVDAMAQLRMAIDDRLLAALKADAKYLLGVHLPAFDHQRDFSIAELRAIQAAAQALQDQLQERVQNLQFLARDSVHPSVQPLLKVVLDAYEQGFCYAEQVRWEAMNGEAEAEIKAGVGKSFGSMDAALAYLAKQR